MARRKKNDAQESLFDPATLEDAGTFVPMIDPSDMLPLYGDYRKVTTLAELEELCAHLDDAIQRKIFVAYDTEFAEASVPGQSGLDPHRPGVTAVGLSYAMDDTAYYVPIGHRNLRTLDSRGAFYDQLPADLIRESLSPRMVRSRIATHNGKIDGHILARSGYQEVPIAFDTMTAAHFLQYRLQDNQRKPFIAKHGNANGFVYRKGLKQLSEVELGWPTIHFEDVMVRCGQGRTRQPDVRSAYIDDMVAYAGHDAMQTLALANMFYGYINGTFMQPVYERIFMPLLTVLGKMERRGITVDMAHFGRLMEKYDQQLRVYDEKLYELVGRKVEWGKDNQVRWLLFEHYGLPILNRTASGESEVTKESLNELTTYVKERWLGHGHTSNGTSSRWGWWSLPAAKEGALERTPQNRDLLLSVIKTLQSRSKIDKLRTTYDLRQKASTTF